MDESAKQRLAELILKLRMERQESQRQFAKSLGVSYSAARSWELGEALPGLENLETIANMVGLSLEGLVKYLRTGSSEQAEAMVIVSAADVLSYAERLSRSDLVELAKLLIDRLGE